MDTGFVFCLMSLYGLVSFLHLHCSGVTSCSSRRGWSGLSWVETVEREGNRVRTRITSKAD